MRNKVTKSQKEYKEKYKQLREIGALNFKYDLRRSLTVGQKAAISKAYNDNSIHAAPGSQFLPIPRERGESKKHHTKRIQKIKRQFGQSGTALNGIHLHVNPNVTAKVKGDRVVTTKAVSETGDVYEYQFIGLDKDAFFDDIDGYIRDIINTEKPDVIYLNIGGNTSGKYSMEIPWWTGDGATIDDAIDEFISSIQMFIGKYQETQVGKKGQVLTDFITGFTLQFWGDSEQ